MRIVLSHTLNREKRNFKIAKMRLACFIAHSFIGHHHSSFLSISFFFFFCFCFSFFFFFFICLFSFSVLFTFCFFLSVFSFSLSFSVCLILACAHLIHSLLNWTFGFATNNSFRNKFDNLTCSTKPINKCIFWPG